MTDVVVSGNIDGMRHKLIHTQNNYAYGLEAKKAEAVVSVLCRDRTK